MTGPRHPGDGFDPTAGADDGELDGPLPMLADLRHPPRGDLLRAVRAAIHRRLLAAQAVDFVWQGATHALIEVVKMVLEMVFSATPRKGGRA
jgi:hypothetical protein